MVIDPSHASEPVATTGRGTDKAVRRGRLPGYFFSWGQTSDMSACCHQWFEGVFPETPAASSSLPDKFAGGTILTIRKRFEFPH